ncbi:MAG: energy-coupling factor ABC transporter ATP-binding protein [Treponema sp.]|nr:energy-coupling factor ABC transporter ATP-binding protein [Treponema sp.]
MNSEKNRAGLLFSVRKVSKIFKTGGGGENRALEGVSLDIYQGECLLIAGSNGSGKTLLMKILAGLMAPSAGEVFFLGENLEKAAVKLRSGMGLVFQDADAQIVGETVAEDIAFGPRNLGLPGDEVRRRVETALGITGLTGKQDLSPRRLSGGEKRRLAVAGVMAMGCFAVIMDEPFANLDFPGVVQVLEIIRDLKRRGNTVIILTHELEKALAFADRMVILHRGMIRDTGKPAEVLARLRDEYGIRNPLHSYSAVEDCTWLG